MLWRFFDFSGPTSSAPSSTTLAPSFPMNVTESCHQTGFPHILTRSRRWMAMHSTE